MQDEQALYTQLDLYKNIYMAFSQAAISEGYFPKRKLPKWAISQAATSQACPRPQRTAPY